MDVWRNLALAELLLPCLDGEQVVDGDNVDVLYALLEELVGVLQVAWYLRRAGGRECTRNAWKKKESVSRGASLWCNERG